MHSNVTQSISHRKEPEIHTIRAKELTDECAEAYYETLKDKEYSTRTANDLLAKMSMNYKTRLERAHTGYAFYIYTMLSDSGKLARRSITLFKSDGLYDVAVQQYMAGDKSTNPDCICLVSATQLTSERVSDDMKDDKAAIKTEAKSIVTEAVTGKTLNEVENRKLANDIARDIKTMIKSKKYQSNCMIGVIIGDPELEYIDGVISTSNQDMLKIQVSYKTYQFNVSVLIVATPCDSQPVLS